MNRRPVLFLLALSLPFLLAATALAGEFEREFRFTTDDLKVVNMIGHIEVVPSAGDAFEVRVAVRGADAGEDLITFDTSGDGRALAIRFPIKDHDKYVYPELGRGGKTTLSFRDEGDHGNSWLREIFSGFEGTRVTVQGQGRGKEVWADVTIAVPRGAGLEVRHGVGRIDADGVQADLNLDTSSGAVTVQDITGDVLVDTGSGHVTATGITGDLNIDTGSGHVELTTCSGDEIKVDTGSGSVTADELACRRLDIDTGSGGVKARRVRTDGARIDTGSGSVLLDLDRMGEGKYLIDTGSGGIELVVPGDASARIVADTGSGSVRCDLADVTIEQKERNEMKVQVGAGASQVRLDAGSGSIRISGR